MSTLSQMSQCCASADEISFNAAIQAPVQQIQAYCQDVKSFKIDQLLSVATKAAK
jgi:hypothetical protein